jgi:hypothetical protein
MALVSRYVWLSALIVVPTSLFLLAILFDESILSAMAGVAIPMSVVIAFVLGYFSPRNHRRLID